MKRLAGPLPASHPPAALMQGPPSHTRSKTYPGDGTHQAPDHGTASHSGSPRRQVREFFPTRGGKAETQRPLAPCVPEGGGSTAPRKRQPQALILPPS